MSSRKLSPYIVQELPDISDVVNELLKFGVRIKYTCFDVSQRYIVFGATSGGAYMFHRAPCQFVQLIPSKNGPATLISISPDERHIAIANSNGWVTVTNIEQTPGGQSSSISSKDHVNNEISSLGWGDKVLFIGDDAGNVSVLQLYNFIAKTLFQNASQIIMTLDSRICQFDIRDFMLLVSTLTRCYICDTSKELYRLIGQKLREGKFGACFGTSKTMDNCQCAENHLKELKHFNIVIEDHNFFVNEKFCNTLIYCARPSSRLWEASMDGTVKRTLQYKEVLAKQPAQIITTKGYEDDDVNIEITDRVNEAQSCSFEKIYSMQHAIFSFSSKALFFLNIDKIEDTIWLDNYKDIVDCKVHNNTLYLWLQSGNVVNLKYYNLEKYLIQCYLDAKYKICAKLIELHSDYLLSNIMQTEHLHVLVGLREKLGEDDYDKIRLFIEKIDERKSKELTPVKHGVVVVDNTYHTQAVLDSDDKITSARSSPEGIPTLKDISATVADTINISKKIIKDKLVDLGGKVKNLSQDSENDNTDTSQKAMIANKGTCKLLYNKYISSPTNKDIDINLIIDIIEKYSTNIKDVCDLMIDLDLYSENINANVKYISNHIFLMYIDNNERKDQILEDIIQDIDAYKYFVDSCINVNSRQLSLGCECGFPLPYRADKTPEYSALLDLFIEKQWASPNSEQLHEICKRMPYAWKKILILRKNEDLMNILRLLLQMLDESLLHTFLPQFTINIWDCAVKLYATLHGNLCLNCNKKFDSIIVKNTMNWDDLGLLMIKSVGGRNAIKIMEVNSQLILMGELTKKFYNASLLAALFEKYDPSTIVPLTDTIYDVYGFDKARNELSDLLRATLDGHLKNTALPLIVAANTSHWGLKHDNKQKIYRDFKAIIHILKDVGNMDCSLCGLPVCNLVLIQDGGLWVFKCGHIYHGQCLDVNRVKLCTIC